MAANPHCQCRISPRHPATLSCLRTCGYGRPVSQVAHSIHDTRSPVGLRSPANALHRLGGQSLEATAPWSPGRYRTKRKPRVHASIEQPRRADGSGRDARRRWLQPQRPAIDGLSPPGQGIHPRGLDLLQTWLAETPAGARLNLPAARRGELRTCQGHGVWLRLVRTPDQHLGQFVTSSTSTAQGVAALPGAASPQARP